MLIDGSSGQVLYEKNSDRKLYPASTTKIMTALVALETLEELGLGPDSKVIVPAEAAGVEGSSLYLKAGEKLSLEELLYGLMLQSGNDSAEAIAACVGGSREAFVEKMNRKAEQLGCSGTHFVNPSGLFDENHYTTIYDMYLIFSNAISLESFVTIINSADHDAAYTNASGNAVNVKFSNTCGYLSGAYEAPDGVNVVGGKTGTTHDAGYCLVLYSTNSDNERIISIVYKADGKSNLYLLMNELLSGFAN